MKNLLFALVLFPIGYFTAQTPWNLQECIKYAETHNIGLRRAGLNNDINKNNTDQSMAQMLPSINAGASHVYNFGKTIDRFTNTFANQQVLSQNFFLSSQVVLWSGLSQVNAMRANEYTYLSGVENLKQQQNDLALTVANAYISVIFTDELLKISQHQFEVTKEQLERTQKLVNAGAAAKSLEYDIKAQLANEEMNVTVADNNYYLAVLNLRQLMNLDSISNFSVQRPDINMQESPLLLENNVNQLYETSLKMQPGIKSGDYAILSAERSLAASRGRISPSLTFNANIGTGTSGLAKDVVGYEQKPDTLQTEKFGGFVYYTPNPIFKKTPFAEQFKNNVNKSLGFQLTIPLFNGLQTHTAIKNAKIAAWNAKLGQDLTKQNLYKNITQAYANAKAALNKFHAAQSAVDAANESFTYAQQKLNAGVISAFDFNTAKNRLYSSESTLLQAKYDYVFKLKVLDYYQGKPLGF